MTDTRYIVAGQVDFYEEMKSDLSASEAAEFLINWYASIEFNPEDENMNLYLYLDDGSIDLYDDFSYEKYANKELNVVDHINTYASTQLVFKFPGQDESLDTASQYLGIEEQVASLHAFKHLPDLEYIRIRYRLEPEWKTVS